MARSTGSWTWGRRSGGAGVECGGGGRGRRRDVPEWFDAIEGVWLRVWGTLMLVGDVEVWLIARAGMGGTGGGAPVALELMRVI